MAYGVTSAGFVIKPLQIIKTELETSFKAAFGNDLDVSTDSVAGQLIGNLSAKYIQLWEVAQGVYNAFNPDRATGASLDGNAALVAVKRLSAVAEEVYVTLYGDAGTAILAGDKVKQSTSGQTFSLITSKTIALTSLSDYSFIIDAATALTNYSITMNGTTYTFASGVSPTKATITAGLIALIAAGQPLLMTSQVGDAGWIKSADGITEFSISLGSLISSAILGTPALYRADTAGVLSISIGTIDTIITSRAGLDSVSNLASGSGGRNLESDEELRIRRRVNLAGKGQATEDAIRAHILDEIDGVSYVNVVSNRTNGVVDSRPAKSFEVIVLGGDEQLIADNIWTNGPAGIETVGSVTKTVVDSSGDSQTIKFSRPTYRYIWIKVTVSLNAEESFPSNGQNLIKDNILLWASNNINVGVDVIRQKMFGPIFDVPGIATADPLTLAVTTTLTPPASGDYTETNATIAANELALFDATRITVNVI